MPCIGRAEYDECNTEGESLGGTHNVIYTYTKHTTHYLIFRGFIFFLSIRKRICLGESHNGDNYQSEQHQDLHFGLPVKDFSCWLNGCCI